MGVSQEMRRLQNKWLTGSGWPKRLEWLEVNGIRGWVGQRIDFSFPIVALVGENGSGKSTILQSAASIYKSQPNDSFASDFFPDTPIERITAATIRFSYRQGNNSQTKTIRKPTDRWRGNPDRPERRVEYIDLRRTLPVGARVGFAKLLKSGVEEGEHQPFDEVKLQRLSQIIGKNYTNAGLSVTNADTKRAIPVVEIDDERYSGFHQGAGEVTSAELLAADYPKYGLILIDEIESSLHPRAQRRLIRDLAKTAREQELQIILSTHSPYILDEIPAEGRIYLMDGVSGKTVVGGVSPEFAMTKMDEEQHPECDIYVEDIRAATLVGEMLVKTDRDLLARVRIIPYGAASVGMALGQMCENRRFPRPSRVFLDGDQSEAVGCGLLPGQDAPEIVIFTALQAQNWPNVAERIGRGVSETIDSLNRAMTISNHHDWVNSAGDRLAVGGDILWQALAASWSNNCATAAELLSVSQPVRDALDEAS